MLINLKSAHGTFVVAEGSVGDVVNANRAAAGEWELFGLCDPLGVPLPTAPMSGATVTIRAKPGHPDSRLLLANWTDGSVRATALAPLGAAFTILKVGASGGVIGGGDSVAFRSPQKVGRFPGDPQAQWGWLTAEGQDPRPVVCDRRGENPGAWETFKLLDRGASIPRVDLRGRLTQTPSHASGFQMTAQQYQERFDVLAADGYRPLWVHASPAPLGATQYAAVWVRDRPPRGWRARHGIDAATFDADHTRNTGAGLELVCLSGCPSPQGTRYAAIWWAREPGVDMRHVRDLTAAQYQEEFRLRNAEGFMPICVTAWPDGNQARYAAVFRRPRPAFWFARHGLGSAAHQALIASPPIPGARPLSVAGAHVGSNDEFASVFAAENIAWAARHDASDTDLHMESLRRGAHGNEPISISGYGNGFTSKYTGVWIAKPRRFVASGPQSVTPVFTEACDDRVRDFMQPRGIRGLTLAVAVNDRLVLARGYSNDTGEEPPAQPTSLARIASISKPLTAVAIFRLIEDGKLDLDDTMMSILKLDRGPDPPKGDINAITVRHLLQHVAGWEIITREADATGPEAVNHLDPMFLDQVIAARLRKPLPISREDIIEFMTKFRRVDFPPGTFYRYANYGYCLLGKIIEAKSGLGYGPFVAEQVLSKLGIGGMRLGRTGFNQRAPGELAYYTRGVGLTPSVRNDDGRPVMTAYGGFNIENMDAHGGWLASAVDLTRFAVAFQRNPPASVLRADTIKVMLSPSDVNGGYGCGWMLNGNGSHGHNGALPGTWTEMRSGWTTKLGAASALGVAGVCYAILATSRSPDGDMPFDADGVQEFLTDRSLLPNLPWDTAGLIEDIVKNQMPDPTGMPELLFP